MPGLLQPKREIIWHDDGTADVRVWPIFGGDPATMRLPLTEAQYNRWLASGDYIQHNFPHLSSDQREFLLSGLTPEMWDAMFKEEEE